MEVNPQKGIKRVDGFAGCLVTGPHCSQTRFNFSPDHFRATKYAWDAQGNVISFDCYNSSRSGGNNPNARAPISILSEVLNIMAAVTNVDRLGITQPSKESILK